MAVPKDSRHRHLTQELQMFEILMTEIKNKNPKLEVKFNLKLTPEYLNYLCNSKNPR